MAIIKCKMCGGDLTLMEGQSVAECEYCGSRQTVPAADNEKKLTLFARANRLRAACEFDKAAGIYETIVADFPEEAEAYWGLVLCKYGIEYVDDPATGKKIPTCHRSSFDSIMDDGNFEQALENADAIARKVYREEAKQIEEIRKGIIAVSSNEQPYDIFICYKETDENGERTLDSVLAQDIYDALESKGYRTFFARITLEDKLGMEYEPYIFAALNSAKIMLAIGTDYEYYNAVWVKNEWSRYLKLMTQDKTKHLIPCYKGIDAYDMPKEFARLQAQDLGKVGAMQDLMRGIEKILPKQQNTTVIQERVVVGGGGDNKIASLLDRGNMALEDGDWAKADSFFEDVLNNDSKNAQAYIGKTLAQERCRTIDAFVRKRKGLYETVKGQKLELEPAAKHIEEMALQCRIPYYLTAGEIRNLYQFDLHYHSDVEERRQQYQKEVTYWANHKQLSRAEKFAAGAVAENLQREKKALFAALSEQVKKAEATEAGHKKSVQERYAQHIAQMDAKATQLHQEAAVQREQDYRNWVMKVKNTEDLETLRAAESYFANQGDYQKCPALALHCQKRIVDITAENERLAAEAKAAAEAEAERKRIAKAKADAARKKKNRTIAIITAIVLALVIAAVAVVTMVIIPNSKLSDAQTLMDSGDYQGAYDILINLNGYKNSDELLEEVGQHGMYAVTTAVMDNVEYDSSDYNYIFTYTEKGFPLTCESGSNNGGRYFIRFEYTWYESGNPETCTARYDDGEIAFKVAFYDSPDARIVYAPGERLYRNAYWHTDGEWMFYGAELFENYWQDEVSSTYRYTENGVNAAWICEYDAEGRLTQFYEADGKGCTRLSYNDKGEIDVVIAVDDRSDPDSIWNDEYKFNYTYDQYGRLATWDYQEEYSDVPDCREVYTYDESGNVIQIDAFRLDETYSGKDYLEENYTCTMTYEWLDFAQLAEQAAGQRAEEEAAQTAREERLAADYAAAEALYAAGDYRDAALAFAALGDYSDAADRFQSIWAQVDKTIMLSAGYGYTVGVCADGTVRTTSSDVEEWLADMDNIVAISGQDAHVVGMRADGTVVAGGDNTYEQLNVGTWRDIVAVSAGTYHTVGLKSDGTVVATGFNDHGQCDVSDWTNIVAIAAAQVHTVGLRADGTVVAVGFNDDGRCDVEEWTDIVQISACNGQTVGLKSDGTVVATGYNEDGQCNVEEWTDIVSVATGYFHTLGLRSDGTVVAIGYDQYDQCDVDGWTDIVAIWAGGYHSIGMKADGTVVAVGNNDSNQRNVTKWTDMMYQN